MKNLYISLIAIVFYSLAFVSVAEENVNMANLLTCRQITPANERLACYDALVKQDPVTAITKQTVKNKEKAIDDFAKEHIKKSTNEQGLNQLSSKVAKLKQLIRGEWVITLENGQTWQQKDSKKFKLKVGDVIRLEKGMLGSVSLYVEGSNRSIAVKRLK